jgi:hypothetical protein
MNMVFNDLETVLLHGFLPALTGLEAEGLDP